MVEFASFDLYILCVGHLKVDVEIIAEMLSFFVMHYFCYTPELPESQKKALLLSGKTRHEKFMELLAKRMQGKGSSSILGLSEVVSGGGSLKSDS